MFETIMEIIICLLAAYGFFTLLHDLVMTIKQRANYKNPMVKLVLLVKNQGDVIECILRNVLSRDVLRKLIPQGKLIILDMGSKDDTLDILRKLEKDYECLEVIRKGERETIFRNFDE